MCQKPSLVVGLVVGGWIMTLLSCVCFFMGIGLNSWDRGTQAYGSVIAASGGSLIFGAILMCPIGALSSYSAKQHNKFGLMFVLGSCGFLIFLLLLLGGLVHSRATSGPLKYPHATLERCMYAITPPDQTAEEAGICKEFVESDEYFGLQMMWTVYHRNGQLDPTDLFTLNDFQVAGDCCGFGKPFACQTNVEDRPGGYPSMKSYGDPRSFEVEVYGFIGDETGRKQRCGLTTPDGLRTFYPPDPGDNDMGCDRVVSYAVLPYRYGGCPMEMPVGDCKKLAQTTMGLKGCAAQVANMVGPKVATFGTIILAFTLVPSWIALCSIVLLMKRKDMDVMPATYPGLVNPHKANMNKKFEENADDFEDGMLLLQIAEKPHEFLKAFSVLIKELNGGKECNWELSQILDIVSTKKAAAPMPWPKEVDSGFSQMYKAAQQKEMVTTIAAPT
jgi:hypothetical protein